MKPFGEYTYTYIILTKREIYDLSVMAINFYIHTYMPKNAYGTKYTRCY